MLFKEGDLVFGPGGIIDHGNEVIESLGTLELFGVGFELFVEEEDHLADGDGFVGDRVDQFSLKPVAAGLPFVLANDDGVDIVLVDALIDLIAKGDDEALGEGDEGEGVLQIGREVENADFDGPEARVGPYIPPDFADTVEETAL